MQSKLLCVVKISLHCSMMMYVRNVPYTDSTVQKYP